jgi:hypothetical protein
MTMSLKDHMKQLGFQLNAPTNIVQNPYPVCSAAKAKDFMDGNIRDHHKLMMSQIVTDYEKRKFLDVTEEIVKMVIERTALTYIDDPVRECWTPSVVEGVVSTAENEDATTVYRDILHRSSFDAVTPEADKIARLLKTAGLLGWWRDDNDSIFFNQLDISNMSADVCWKTGRTESVLITREVPHELNGTGRCYTYYTPEYVQDYVGTKTGLTPYSQPEPNIYRDAKGNGIIPMALLYDAAVPRSGVFQKGEPWQSLVALNELVNLLDTIYAHGARWQALATRVSNIRQAAGKPDGPDTTVQPAQDMMVKEVMLEYKSPTINVKEFSEWMNGTIKRVSDQWSLTTDYNGSGSANSGFQVMVEENWNLVNQKMRRKNAHRFEQQVYTNIVMPLANANGYKLPDNATIYCEFKDVALPVDIKGQWGVDREQLAAGITSKGRLIQKYNSGWDDKDVQNLIEEISKESGGAKMLTDAKNRIDAAMTASGA